MGTAAVLFGIFLISLPAYLLELSQPVNFAGLERPTRPLFALALLRGLLSIAAVLMCFSLATILFRHKREDRVAVVASFILLIYGVVSAGPLERFAVYEPALDAVAQRLLYVGAIPWVIFFCIFPSGQFVPSWSRWLPGFAVVWALVLAAFHPFSTFGSSAILPLIELLWIMSLALLMVYVQVWRFRHVSSDVERRQTQWIVFGLLATLVLFTVSTIPWVYVQSQPAGTIDVAWANWVVFFLQVIWVLMLCVLPLAMTVAVLRYRLWDIDLILNRALVYTLMSALVVSLYIILVGLLGGAFQARGHVVISLLATAVVALLFQPLRERVQRRVNRWIYGERDNPYVVLAHLGQRLEAALTPGAVLPTLVETVAVTLKLPYVGIALREGDEFRIEADHGIPPAWLRDGEYTTSCLTLPLIHQSEVVGQLLLAPRSPADPFTPTEHGLLADIARQVGVAAHAVRLAADLQRSRERLVTAREEERRRLRRDLHDGLGPSLAAMSFKLDASANLVASDPDTARKSVSDVKAQIQTLLAEIRRIAYNLRPPALDELGLVGALREHIASNQAPGLHFTLEAPDTLPPLAAAVEVAVYRIVLEAIHNVTRHAEARHCSVRMTLCDDLCLEVSDDGRGLPAEYRPGVGLGSMRERAEELGGVCVVERRPEGGTRVSARLPLLVHE